MISVNCGAIPLELAEAELFGNVKGARNALQVRLDVLNVGNIINHSWGQGYTFVTTQPLVSAGADANGALTYTLKTTGTTAATTSLITTLVQRTVTSGDVYRFQLGGRYSFF